MVLGPVSWAGGVLWWEPGGVHLPSRPGSTCARYDTEEPRMGTLVHAMRVSADGVRPVDHHAFCSAPVRLRHVRAP